MRFSVLNSFYSKCISSLPQPILYTIRPKVNNDPRICLQSCRRNDKSSLASKSIFADSDGYERERRNGFFKKSKLKTAFFLQFCPFSAKPIFLRMSGFSIYIFLGQISVFLIFFQNRSVPNKRDAKIIKYGKNLKKSQLQLALNPLFVLISVTRKLDLGDLIHHYLRIRSILEP